ncbi:RNA polymerase sigma factor SigJ [Nonomuraea sediminis]|uniref:RNA polymerase sigma factor SigJ n=1 Tax=Nonomuraea sediminis TaxID=2835864 RepID=UPI001BDCD8C0|nr:RNA polymerase sigma factor SigJ [Nonomuraea sediminis]
MAEFDDHRELLFSMVYNMLGSVADTEDVLQETWLAWDRRSRGTPVEHPRAYLVRIAVNQALARQNAISRRRETYVGPWLPEPLVSDASEQVLRGESVSMALMVVLETLTPLERAVFVLHEVFGYAHTEIGRILGRTPASVRQVAHRAREHVQARRPRYSVDPGLRREVTERFVRTAFEGGSLASLMELLAPDVTLWADGGGKAPAAGRHPVHGRERVAKVLIARRHQPLEGLDIRWRQVNGDPSALIFAAGAPYAVLVLELTPDGTRISAIYAVTNPDKLTHAT